MKRYIVTLTDEERKTLSDLTSKGTQRSQKVLNALILLDCDEGGYQTERSTNEEIARVLRISMRKIDRVKKRFVEEGLDAALDKKAGSRVYTKKTDGDFEAHLIALSCGEPPEGFARWSLRLLADKVVELNYIDDISHETVRRILKKRNQAMATQGMGYSTRSKR
jgi:transposase